MASIFIFVGGFICGVLVLGLFVERWIKKAKAQWAYERDLNAFENDDIQFGMTDPPD